ncbi:PfkB family carbohydrate kinase [uncultured Leifsonia sp.]|uniref:PfkB family carbohydrate kinase n=1 Tax=uncultured Leifsonia sp. TaxID=340359 RepID=UPI0028D200EC|nr:PfkB family carbohydrate kinase [uncultured Leifsonia sp.]
MHGIALAGHLCVDLAPAFGRAADIDPGRLHEVGPLRITLGGCVANTGRALGDLGGRARVHAAVGDDELGSTAERLLATLPGLTGRLQSVGRAATSYSVVLESPGQDRTFWHHVGANAAFDGAEVELDGVDILHLGYPSLLPGLLADDAEALVALLGRAKERGITTSVDLAVVDPASPAGALNWNVVFDRMLPLVDLLTPSVDDLTSALGLPSQASPEEVDALVQSLIERGAAVAAVSAGSAGLFVRTGSAQRLRTGGRALACVAEEWADRALHQATRLAQEPVTTNGAGDASTAGFLYGAAVCAPLESAASLAAACATAVLTGRSATPNTVVAIDPALAAVFPAAAPGPRAPIVLEANQPVDRFYAGGERIAGFRGTGRAVEHTPEDWVGSVTTVRGQGPLGLTHLGDGEALADAVRRDPVAWLGESHVARWGADTKLLVKLLDARERLPVHAHPDTAFAHVHVGTEHGKAEAWYILEPGVVHLGLREAISRERLDELVERQDGAALLGLLHQIAVRPGDRVFVPPGTLHAIGAGVFLAEVQEPEDLSILLEWRGYALDGERDGHLGLGFPLALDAVDRSPLARESLAALVRPAGDASGSLPPAADPYFRLDRLDVDGRAVIAPGFAVVIVIEGELVTEYGDWSRGTTVLVPAAAGPVGLAGSGTLLVARPPVP